jgi:hypothetical protein
LFWLWLLLAGEWNRDEWVAAAIAAATAAALAEQARLRLGISARIPVRELAGAWRLPWDVLVDFGLVVGVLLLSPARRRATHGRLRWRSFQPGGADAAGFGRRAWLEYAATVSPNAYVVEVDRERGQVLLHDLVPRRASEEPIA